MPTPGERLATLEAMGLDFTRQLNDLRQDITDLRHDIHGGGDIEWNRSVRGRLHSQESTLRGMAVVTKHRVSILRGWSAVILTACGVITATCAIVSAVYLIAS